MTKASDEDLKILVCSANLGNAPPFMENMREWIPELGACSGVTALAGQGSIKADQFDIIALGMQESTWKKEQLNHESFTASSSAITDESFHDVQEIKPGTSESSFGIDQMLDGMEAHDSIELKRLAQLTLGNDYSLIVRYQRGQMRLHIWVRNEIADKFTNIDIKAENTGVGHVLANKGGIVASLTYKKTRISFLTAHLAAHEGETYLQSRMSNLKEIFKGTKSKSGLDVTACSHHMFLMGDLNFRTDFGKMEHEEHVQKALDMVEKKEWEKLYSYDELERCMKEKKLLCGFETLPCHFNPTFKVQRESGYNYKTQRTPSYTDRILWKCADGLRDNLTPLAYEPCGEFMTSDHKPIRGAFSIVPNKVSSKQRMVPKISRKFFNLTFKDMQCKNLTALDIDGSSDPFLVFMTDPAKLLHDARSPKKQKNCVKMRIPYVHSTKFIAKNLNPKWTDKMHFTLDRGWDLDTMLHVTAMDFDAASQNDTIGSIALNVHKLVSMDEGATEKEITIEQPLIKYGTEEGSIKMTVVVSSYATKEQSFRKKQKQGLWGKIKSLSGSQHKTREKY